MSADLLRRAAAKLRQHVEKASPGPWTTDSWEIFSEAEAPHWLGETLSVDDEPLSEANAAYIALMHPPVALALAEHLEVLATEQRTSNPFDLMSAETLARTILRSET